MAPVLAHVPTVQGRNPAPVRIAYDDNTTVNTILLLHVLPCFYPIRVTGLSQELFSLRFWWCGSYLPGTAAEFAAAQVATGCAASLEAFTAPGMTPKAFAQTLLLVCY